MPRKGFIPLPGYTRYDETEMLKRSREFSAEVIRRRTVREFSTDTVPEEVIVNAVKAAGSAPSGANKQPWFFAIVKDPSVKKQIRDGAEKEEREFYRGKAPDEWLDALEHLGTDENKPFLEDAPYLIVVFEQKYELLPGGGKRKNYYTKESIGLACGVLITALHHAGLATLTHTPSPMNFLNDILGRPENEKPFLILVTGYPAEGTEVPDIKRKELKDISEII